MTWHADRNATPVLRPSYTTCECINLVRKIMFGVIISTVCEGRFQEPLGLRRRSAIVRLLRLWVRIPPEKWMFVCCECCVLSGRGLCDELINRPEESHRLWCVVVCNLTTSWTRSPWPTGEGGGLLRQKQRGCEGKNKPSVNLITSLLIKSRFINQGSVII